MPVLELGRGADLQVNPRVVEDERKERHETHRDDFVPGTGSNIIEHGRLSNSSFSDIIYMIINI